MAKDIVKPIDPNFTTRHQKLLIDRFAPHFNNCIGAIDDTHIPVVVPASKLVQNVGRHGYPTQNVLAICDFDIRFTFTVAGWSRSVHDMRVFNAALHKYDTISPHPPSGTIMSGTIIRGTLKTPNSQLVTPISIKLQRPDGYD
jgi:hypothetical protein